MKNIKITKVEAYRYKCPYCGYDYGVMEDAGYTFERVLGTVCVDCDKEFSIKRI